MNCFGAVLMAHVLVDKGGVLNAIFLGSFLVSAIFEVIYWALGDES